MTDRNHSLLTLGLLSISLLWSPTAATATKVVTILSGEGGIYRQVFNGINTTLLADNTPADIEILQHILPSGTSEIENFDPLSGSADLVVSIGTLATEFVLASDTETPHLSVLIPQNRFDALLTEHGHKEDGYRSVIFLDQPVERQISLISVLFPPDTKVGVLVDSSRRDLEGRIEESADRHSVKISVSEILPDQNVVRHIRRLVEESDLGLAVDHSLTLQPSIAKWLLYTAYRSRKPIIAFSKAYLNAGALAAVYSTPEQFGRHAGEEIRNIVDPDQTRHPFRRYSRYFSVDFNDSVARSLGVSLPDKEKLRFILNAESGFEK